MENKNEILIYQAENGAIELRTDTKNATVWATQADLSFLFDKDQSVISRHIKNIFKDGELDENSNMHKMHIANSDKLVSFYALDIILAVGYRVNSTVAIKFRQWATQILKQHIIKGYTINAKIIEQNKTQFLQTLEDLKLLTQNNQNIETKDILSLIQSFSSTFFALDSYDKSEFPTAGTLEEIQATASELKSDLLQLKVELIKKGEATQLFGQEKKQGNLEGIFGNVFQSVMGQDAYPSIEEKAAHLLYFIIKNHPFNDGNKRSGAFSFVWLLQKANYNFKDKISPETLTTLTLLIAESNPNDKEKMIGIVLLLLNPEKK